MNIVVVYLFSVTSAASVGKQNTAVVIWLQFTITIKWEKFYADLTPPPSPSFHNLTMSRFNRTCLSERWLKRVWISTRLPVCTTCCLSRTHTSSCLASLLDCRFMDIGVRFELSSLMISQTDLSLYLDINTWDVVVQEMAESSLSLS